MISFSATHLVALRDAAALMAGLAESLTAEGDHVGAARAQAHRDRLVEIADQMDKVRNAE